MEVFRDGIVTKDWTFAEVREAAKIDALKAVDAASAGGAAAAE